MLERLGIIHCMENIVIYFKHEFGDLVGLCATYADDRTFAGNVVNNSPPEKLKNKLNSIDRRSESMQATGIQKNTASTWFEA